MGATVKSYLDVPTDERYLIVTDEDFSSKVAMAKRADNTKLYLFNKDIADNCGPTGQILHACLSMNDVKVSFAVILLVIYLCERPEEAVVWAYTLNKIYKQNNKKTITVDLFLDNFAEGLPKQDIRTTLAMEQAGLLLNDSKNWIDPTPKQKTFPRITDTAVEKVLRAEPDTLVEVYKKMRTENRDFHDISRSFQAYIKEDIDWIEDKAACVRSGNIFFDFVVRLYAALGEDKENEIPTPTQDTWEALKASIQEQNRSEDPDSNADASIEVVSRHPNFGALIAMLGETTAELGFDKNITEIFKGLENGDDESIGIMRLLSKIQELYVICFRLLESKYEIDELTEMAS